ncbi:MAG: hypothetical protein QNJ38_23565 [Prochloraceae cyanobacterium]|nr:hypothetical protein [Prochloraceae cyanobacterium]
MTKYNYYPHYLLLNIRTGLVAIKSRSHLVDRNRQINRIFCS